MAPLAINVLRRGWKDTLTSLVRTAEQALLLCSPYVTREGTRLVAENLSEPLRRSGSVLFVTDLSPMNVTQGATDPEALQELASSVNHFVVMHLPRLHAKVYVSDEKRAVITSGNLTAGGVLLNYEYGVELSDRATVETVRRDITSYSELGATISPSQLASYSAAARDVRYAFKQQQSSATRALRLEFQRKVRVAEDELVRLRLAGGAMHTVFAKTIFYLLGKHGPMLTEQLYSKIESIHPDLCDNSVDRVIDGKSFGKKWKHAVRTAQQQLKRRGLITLHDGRWTLTGATESPVLN